MTTHNDKPSNATLELYKNKVEKFLSSQNISVEIILRDTPIEMYTVFNGQKSETIFFWIDCVKVSTPTVKDLLLEIYLHENIAITDNDIKIWQFALDVQNALYRHLGKQTGRPQDGDPYWDLWNQIK